MNFGSIGQTTVDQSFVNSVCNFQVGSNGILWSQCNVPSRRHVLYMMLKRILIQIQMHASQINGTLNLSFACMIFLKISNQIGRAWCKSFHMCDCVHPCAKFEVILTMLGELMVGKQCRLHGRGLMYICMHDRLSCISYLNFESSRVLVQNERLFIKVYYFHGQYVCT